jgi:hypothetical protein
VGQEDTAVPSLGHHQRLRNDRTCWVGTRSYAADRACGKGVGVLAVNSVALDETARLGVLVSIMNDLTAVTIEQKSIVQEQKNA